MAGASCVQVGTANFAEPAAALRVRDELRELLASLGIARVIEARGVVARPDPEPPWHDPAAPEGT
jgi:dihydroorotate dehydrogenase (NAD+) catalytic subunit